jgi:hypothetical protein
VFYSADVVAWHRHRDELLRTKKAVKGSFGRPEFLT